MNFRLLFLPVLGLFYFPVVSSQEPLTDKKNINSANATASIMKDSVTTKKHGRNYIIANLSFMNININYERNILRKPSWDSNLKIGYGTENDLQGGNRELILSWVQLFGKRNSHAELNLGLVYTKNLKENLNPLVTDCRLYYFAGYRFEKPDGHFIFRAGFIYPSIYAVSLGFGIKF